MSAVLHQALVHEIATDGLPDMDVLVGKVAFIFDGSIVSGWPLPHGAGAGGEALWEGNSDFARQGPFAGVTHWVEFSEPVHRMHVRAFFEHTDDDVKVAAMLAEHRPTPCPTMTIPGVRCSCDPETSMDLVAYARHMLGVGRGPAVAADPVVKPEMTDEQHARDLLATSRSLRMQSAPTAPLGSLDRERDIGKRRWDSQRADVLLEEAQVHATLAVLDGLAGVQGEIERTSR